MQCGLVKIEIRQAEASGDAFKNEVNLNCTLNEGAVMFGSSRNRAVALSYPLTESPKRARHIHKPPFLHTGQLPTQGCDP